MLKMGRQRAPLAIMVRMTSPYAPTTTPPTWTDLYNRYLGFATSGHCINCHLDMLSAASAYLRLSRLRQIDVARSALVVRGESRLSWFGGAMPLGGAKALPNAEREFAA